MNMNAFVYAMCLPLLAMFQVAPAASDFGFRVVPEPLLPESSSLDDATGFKAADQLFPFIVADSEPGGVRPARLPWSLLETNVHWARVRVVGEVGTASLPQPLLRNIGHDRITRPSIAVRTFLSGVFPDSRQIVPPQVFCVSPAALEASVAPHTPGSPAYTPAAVVIRFEEICLPDANDQDRSHVHRTVFLIAESNNAASLLNLLDAMNSDDPEIRRRTQRRLSKMGERFTVVGEYRQRVDFVK